MLLSFSFLTFPIEDAVEEAESLIRRVVEELSNPAMGGVTCTPSFLLERTRTCLDVIDNATANFSLYNNDSSGNHEVAMHGKEVAKDGHNQTNYPSIPSWWVIIFVCLVINPNHNTQVGCLVVVMNIIFFPSSSQQSSVQSSFPFPLTRRGYAAGCSHLPHGFS